MNRRQGSEWPESNDQQNTGESFSTGTNTSSTTRKRRRGDEENTTSSSSTSRRVRGSRTAGPNANGHMQPGIVPAIRPTTASNDTTSSLARIPTASEEQQNYDILQTHHMNFHNRFHYNVPPELRVLPLISKQHYDLLKIHHRNLTNEVQEIECMMGYYHEQGIGVEEQEASSSAAAAPNRRSLQRNQRQSQSNIDIESLRVPSVPQEEHHDRHPTNPRRNYHHPQQQEGLVGEQEEPSQRGYRRHFTSLDRTPKSDQDERGGTMGNQK